MNSLRIEHSRGVLALTLCASAALLIVLTFALVAGAHSWREYLICVGVILLASCYAATSAHALLAAYPLILIDEDGIVDGQLLFGVGRISWHDIRRTRAVFGKTDQPLALSVPRVVEIVVADKAACLRQLPALRRVFAVVKNANRRSAIGLYRYPWQIPLDAVVACLRDRHVTVEEVRL